MNWNKLGRIFDVSEYTGNELTHCMTSFAMPLEDDGIYRIYFNSRNTEGHSLPYFIEININKPKEILKFSEQAVLELGDHGTFDEAGVVFTSYINRGDEIWFYYSGFPRTAKQIFQAFTGIAISKDGGLTAKRMYEGPVIGLSKDEPYWAAGPRIYKHVDEYLLYYTSSEGWQKKDNELVHMYNIKLATSKDGVQWLKGKHAINFKNDHEYAIAIPSIIIEDGKWKMWYTYRAQKNIKTYRIGYAESLDGKTWIRKDEEMAQFDVSPNGWDSEMLCFPYVFKTKNGLYMIHNGNDFGKNGIGLARLL